MSPFEDPVIRTHGLTKTYGNVNVLDSLDLHVPKHSVFGFLGPNGAGKSTTIKILLGLARPTSGGGTIFGQDVVRDSIDIRRRVGHLAQDPRFYGHMTARETLRFTARFFYQGPKDAIEERIAWTLELVGLDDKADRPIKAYSGGERQRLGIAQAQINQPDLLILDEPAAALDPMGRRDVLEVMERLRKHTTIFYSTHILEDVQRTSDSVAILNRGRLVAQAPVEELLAGRGASVYTISLTGDIESAHARVSRQPWVSHVSTTGSNCKAAWQVTVTDERAAEAKLLRLLLVDDDLTVTDFGLKRQNLEEAFVHLVEGDTDGRA